MTRDECIKKLEELGFVECDPFHTSRYQYKKKTFEPVCICFLLNTNLTLWSLAFNNGMFRWWMPMVGWAPITTELTIEDMIVLYS